MNWPEAFFYSVIAIVSAPIWLIALFLGLCIAIATPAWIVYGIAWLLLPVYVRLVKWRRKK